MGAAAAGPVRLVAGRGALAGQLLPLAVDAGPVPRDDGPRDDGAGAAWPDGAPAVLLAAGRVAFADWLRGFGNLLILDHGEGILSVYGNNESVLVSTGERIEAGAQVATVGTSGGHREPGLYFEMRYEGRPFDPLRWVAAR